MKFRIVQINEKMYRVQKKWLLWWWTVCDNDGCDIPFFSLKEAEDYCNSFGKYPKVFYPSTQNPTQ